MQNFVSHFPFDQQPRNAAYGQKESPLHANSSPILQKQAKQPHLQIALGGGGIKLSKKLLNLA
jgi:hypothetical protein